MPAPVAKGIIITVSVIVAAGIAIYESPQFRQWVNNSRRKVAVALHNLGDEIYPRESSPLREDISMSEEVSPDAEERRRIAREEILRRGVEARRRKRGTSSLGSFDALVDKDGNLRKSAMLGVPDDTIASSTAVDVAGIQSLVGEGNPKDTSPAVAETESQYNQELPEAIGSDGLHLEISSEMSPISGPLLDLTPTSEAPDHPFSMGSSQTEDGLSETYYAHPDHTTTNNTMSSSSSPFADALQYVAHQEDSSAASTTGSYSHIDEAATDTLSDDTLSEIGVPTDGIATPASWSEVGSVISGDDMGHH
ncbi:hypothetical protein ASPZODRAFT_128439 [Penicilliopsis zonata CBS 506.65]|uniref:Uncharacterized protein n=1 Tax=Penicilliopsis zonata CBS 506.65 TaxID=1073090 RepID=A0A1L9SRP0_9EURO|nr:hypothetical protein ASPZODRAFT_128439 [Penicilliopsis zonata CBS 506.65]OJJ49882.1 hypothetical protein ASPZODRAFT_128439 [Penicilliopsis zonata CBS 506.65]